MIIKKISEDLSVVELYSEDTTCQMKNSTCNDYGCDLSVTVNVSDSCE